MAISRRISSAPEWDSKNLRDHADKRANVDLNCMETLLGIAPAQLLPGHLRAKSESVFAQPILIYEGQHYDTARGCFGDTRACYVDNDMVLAVTDMKRERFITCYHKHPPDRSCPGKPKDHVESASQILKLRTSLRNRHHKISGLKFIDP
jgi:hypothetical protein